MTDTEILIAAAVRDYRRHLNVEPDDFLMLSPTSLFFRFFGDWLVARNLTISEVAREPRPRH